MKPKTEKKSLVNGPKMQRGIFIVNESIKRGLIHRNRKRGSKDIKLWQAGCKEIGKMANAMFPNLPELTDESFKNALRNYRRKFGLAIDCSKDFAKTTNPGTNKKNRRSKRMTSTPEESIPSQIDYTDSNQLSNNFEKMTIQPQLMTNGDKQNYHQHCEENSRLHNQSEMPILTCLPPPTPPPSLFVNDDNFNFHGMHSNENLTVRKNITLTPSCSPQPKPTYCDQVYVNIVGQIPLGTVTQQEILNNLIPKLQQLTVTQWVNVPVNETNNVPNNATEQYNINDLDNDNTDISSFFPDFDLDFLNE